MDFYTKVCFEVSGKLEDLQKLVDLHMACEDALRNLATDPGDMVRSVFPEWKGEDDYINPASITIKIIEGTPPYLVVEDSDGNADMDYIARLLQGCLLTFWIASAPSFREVMGNRTRPHLLR